MIENKSIGVLTVLITIVLMFSVSLFAQGPNPSTLDTIVVTSSTRTEEKLREVTSNVTIITEKEISESTTTDLGRFLQQHGFASIDYANSQYISIRGMYSTGTTETQARVLVLLNGRRVGITETNQVGLNNIAQIEIIRGPAAIQYGSSAMGGVINLITKRGKPGDYTASLEAGGGSFKLKKYGATFTGGYGNFDFAGSVTYTARGDYDVYGGRKYPFSSINDKTTSNIDFGYNISEFHRIGLNVNYYKANTELAIGSGFSNTWNNYINGKATGRGFDFDNKNFAVIYDGRTESERFDWSGTVSWGSVLKSEPNYTTTQKVKDITGRFGYNSKYIDADIGFEVLKYEIGGDSSGQNTTSDIGVWMTTKGKFLDDNLIFTLGARYDSFDLKPKNSPVAPLSKTNFSPSIGVAYNANDYLKLRANYSTGFMMPTAFNFTGGGTYYVANPNVKPEKSVTYEFGADFTYYFFTSSATFFNTDWEEKIIGVDYPPIPNKYYYINLKEATITGIEFSFNIDLGIAFDWDFELRPYYSLTYFTRRLNKDPSQIINGDDTMPYTPQATHSFGLSFNFPKYDLSSNLNVAYTGKTFVRDYRFNSPTNSKYIYYNFGVSAVDFTLEKGIWKFGNDGDKGRIALKFAVNNLFDDPNQVYLDYPGPGRNFYLGLKYYYN
jgi:vitamin B12 transporter